ncbi:MAG: xanthine dehydrogenase family protein subunit M [Alphaproteobacteria bacterium]|nr:xanthine dehydrogenase family protein subunit M [Alphaproteobacteria bacterium]
MIPASFVYHKAASLKEAVALLAALPEAKLLAGGQSLIAAMKMRLARPSDVIDIAGLRDLSFVRRERDRLVIGALTTHHDVAVSADVQGAIPALAQLAEGIADPAVRHMGTLGGSVANNDPAADYPAAVLALGASVRTTRRTVAADAFFTGMFSTILEPDEIVTEIEFPIPERAGYCKFRNPASRYAMPGVFVAAKGKGARVAVTGAAPSVFRVVDMEAALSRRFATDAIADISVAVEDMTSDLHASAEYRAHLVTVMARRAIQAALG